MSSAEGGTSGTGSGSGARRAYSILLLPDHGGRTRSLRISHFRLTVLGWLAAAAAVLLLGMALSWGYFAKRALRVAPLERQVVELERERERVEALVVQVAEVEEAYQRLRSIFGTAAEQGVSELWLPPPTGRTGPVQAAAAGAGHPTSWPLTERGFVTQPLLEGEVGDHPGVDIAVPTDSYIRAAGPGRVSRVGEDPVLGRFVVIDHDGGYQSLYAHASVILVEEDADVRRNEVVALSGSSGLSSAPHLHFEITRNGERLDPLTVVSQP